MLGESKLKIRMVSQASWIRALMATYIKGWERGKIGGLFGTRTGKDSVVLGWSRAQQAAFLLSLGLTQLADQEVPESAADGVTFAQQIKKLIHPSEMGELFKVIALGKGISPPLAGFQLSDHCGRL